MAEGFTSGGGPPGGPIERYAAERGLQFEAERPVRAVTPLLLSGSGGAVLGPVAAQRPAAVGTLPGGVDGFVAHHVFDTATSASRELTVVVSKVPASLGFVRAMSCRSRNVKVVRSYRDLDHLGKWRQLELESAKFNQLYELEVLEGQREAWVRQLFSPSFIDRLASEAADGFCFELNEGHLTVAEPGLLSEPAELDRLCEAAADVAARIRTESMEDVETRGEEYAGDREFHEQLRRQVEKVDWRTPPDSPRAAARAYQNSTGIGIKPYLRGLAWGIAVGGGGAAIALLVPGFDTSTSVIIAAIAILVGLLVAVLVVSAAAGPRALRLGLEAFMIEFARSHGYELQDRYEFHARNPDLPVPGRAHHAMRGRLPSGQDFTLAFCDDTAEMFSHGQQVYAVGGRALSNDVVITQVGRDREGIERRIAELPDGLRGEIHDGTLLVIRPRGGNMDRDIAGLEKFIADADRVATGY
jgi:hypothetical protein